MTEADNTIREALRSEQAQRETGRAPAFDELFGAAEVQATRDVRRRRAAFGIAAVTSIVAIAALLLLPRETQWQYVNPEDLAMGTTWVAPSDVLLPEHSVDIYRDIPVLIESTDSNGGALL